MPTYNGTAVRDSLVGLAEDDVFYGYEGNDTIVGGRGIDYAMYAGPADGYRVTRAADGTITVQDLDAAYGNEGIDTLRGIEALGFGMAGSATDRISVELGQIVPTGPEQRVNTYTRNHQEQPQIAALDDGGCVVAWISSGQDGSATGIFLQQYAADGSTVGGETQVNTTTTGYQVEPAVRALPDGGWLVAWTSYNRGVFLQRYAADGSAVGSETQVNTSFFGYNSTPATPVVLADGSYVVTWHSHKNEGAPYDVFIQRYTADGNRLGGEERINTTRTDDQFYPHAAALTGGGYVVAWQSFGQDGSEGGIFLQRFNADGSRAGAETQVNDYVTGSQSSPTVTAMPDGGYLVAWQSSDDGGLASDIYLQRYAADGDRVGIQQRVNTFGDFDQWDQQVAVLANGGYVVAWVSWGQDSDGQWAVCAQQYDADGRKVGGEKIVADQVQGWYPEVAALADGGYVVSWSTHDGDAFGVFLQRYDGNGNAIGPLQAAHPSPAGDQERGKIAVLADGGFAITWESLGQDGAGEGVYLQRFAPVAYVTLPDGGSAYAPVADLPHVIVGGAGDDNLAGGTANDTLDGGIGQDLMAGGAGDDTYYVDDEYDWVDEYDGDGNDTVQSSATWMLADACEHLVLTGFAAVDGYGNSAGNRLTGNAMDNRLRGYGGDDTLAGGDGADTLVGHQGRDILDGGAGHDTFLFAARPGIASLDHIVSFDGEFDRIKLSDSAFPDLVAGKLPAHAFRLGSVALDASDRILYDRGTGTLYYDADGDGGASAVKFAVIDNRPVLDAGDFTVA